MKTVKQIIREYLEQHGFDGLGCPGECGCLKEDLALCGCFPSECLPGYKVRCRCGQGCDYDISDTKDIPVYRMKVSDLCRKYHMQSCHECDDLDCGDNTSRSEG